MGKTGTPSNPKAALFATWLRGQMIQRKLSNRGLGKLIDPELPERGRRQVLRHLGVGGPMHFPNRRTRRVYLEVFGLEGDPFSDDDEEADQALARDLKSMVRRQERRTESLERKLDQILEAIR